MSRRPFFISAILVLAACCAAVAVLPARWMLALLPGSGPLAVVDATGTLWSGSATLAVGTAAQRRTLPDPLRWRLSASGGLGLHVSHPWMGGPVAITAGWRGVAVSAQTLQLPAAALATLDARIAAIGPDGELAIGWPATFIGLAERPAGTTLLDVQWRNAVSALTPVRPLGDYALALKQGASGTADLTLGTRRGPLILNGAGVFDRKSGFRFEGTAQADPKADAEVQAALRDVLAALGPRQNNQTLLRFQ